MTLEELQARAVEKVHENNPNAANFTTKPYERFWMEHSSRSSSKISQAKKTPIKCISVETALGSIVGLVMFCRLYRITKSDFGSSAS